MRLIFSTAQTVTSSAKALLMGSYHPRVDAGAVSGGFFEQYSRSPIGRLIRAISPCVNAVKLPGFAVVGNQSSGKTTLLQTISSTCAAIQTRYGRLVQLDKSHH